MDSQRHRWQDGLTQLRWDAVIVAGLLALWLATRLLWILSNPDTASYWEETYRWVAAKEILEGPVQPILDYQADSYQGGSLVLILLVSGFFGIFGESVLALKAAALLFAGATLVSLYVLGLLFFGRTVAVLAAGAYVAGPPLIAYSSLLVMGSHGESALFSLLELILLLGLLDGRFRSFAGWAAFGLVSGLGVWFCYTSGLTVLACAVTWIMLERLPRATELAVALAGFLLGLLPWLTYNLQNDFVGWLRLIELFGGGDPIDAWERVGAGTKLFLLFFRDLPVALVVPFRDAAPRAVSLVLQVGFYVPVVLALGLSATRVLSSLREYGLRPASRECGSTAEDRAELVFWVYAVLFLIVYLGSSFVIQPEKGAHTYRLFLPPITLLLVPVAISAARSLDSEGRARRAAIAAIAMVAMVSVVASIFLGTRPTERQVRHDVREHQLYGYVVRGVLLHRKYEQDLHRAFLEARRVPDLQLRFRIFQGVGWGIQYRYEGTGQIEPALRSLNTLVLGEQAAVLSGLRWTSNERIAELESRVDNSTSTARDLEQLKRLKQLQAHLEARWSQVPPQMRFIDRILY